MVVAAGLIALTVAVRMHPFLEGNDDGDVGTYVLGARALLHGHLPYATVWEYKPPGLFALYALALAVAGDGSRAAALVGLAGASATALALWRLVAHAVPDGERAGILAAVMWACTSIENDGLLGDAELLTTSFATGALLVVAIRAPARCALAGLLAAGAAQMKLSAAPFSAVAAVAVLREGARGIAPFVVGLTAPFALEAAVYAFAHRFGDFWDANAGATLRRIGSRGTLAGRPMDAVALARTLLPALVLAPFALARRSAWTGIFALWLAVDVLTVVAVGEYDARQFLPAVAPLAALAGIGLDAIARGVRFGRALAVLACLLTFALHGYFETVSAVRTAWMRDVRGEHAWRISEVDRIVERLRARPLARDGAWFVEITPLAYDELGVTPPTKYPLTSNLFNRALWPMLGFDGDAEIARIVDVVQPRWIVARRCGPWCDSDGRRRTDARIAGRYDAVEALDDRTVLYRLR